MQITKSISIEQHLIEMRSNQAAWRNRPLLRNIYRHFYQRIRGALTPLPGAIVELGSGIGAAKEFIPTCITTDIFPNPWLDQQENAYPSSLLPIIRALEKILARFPDLFATRLLVVLEKKEDPTPWIT